MLNIVDHPLVQDWLCGLRNRETGTIDFRRLVRNLSAALYFEATRDLPMAPITVQTPLTAAVGARIGVEVVLVPILRAGLGMVDGILEWQPEAAVRHVGIYRDHKTLEAVPYYQPPSVQTAGAWCFVLDPMLATGHSAAAALEMVKQWGAGRVKLVCIIAAPPGVEHIQEKHPDVDIYLCSLDSHLDSRGYIVPGLGDAGDRQFG